MLDARYRAALHTIYSQLHGSDINWALTGSCSFALQGVPVEVHDIDIQADEAGAYEIARRLARYVVAPVAFSRAEHIQSHLGALEIGGVRAEIMGGLSKRLPDGTWEPPVDPAIYRRFVAVDGMWLPVLDLAYEREAYLKLGRLERAELLDRWLGRNSAGSPPDTCA